MSDLRAEATTELDHSSAIVEIPENRELVGIRGSDGRFLPGNCANPGGRPKCALVSDRIKEILKSEQADGRTGAEEIGDKLMSLQRQEKDGYLSLAAIKEMTDRAEGKPVQTVNQKGIFLVAAPGMESIAALDDWAGDE